MIKSRKKRYMLSWVQVSWQRVIEHACLVAGFPLGRSGDCGNGEESVVAAASFCIEGLIDWHLLINK